MYNIHAYNVSECSWSLRDKKLNIMANFIAYTQSLYDSRLKNAIDRLNRKGSIRTKSVLLIINNKGFNDQT